MDRKGSSHTKVEIILALAEDKDGIKKREDFLRSNSRGGYEVVNKQRFLSEKLIREESDGIGIMEKSLSELSRDGYIERTSMGEGIFFKRAYKLKCQDLYELVRTFSFILEAEKANSTDLGEYYKLKRFYESPFFNKAWDEHILDVIYDLGLWDETKYPLKISKVDMMEIERYHSLENPKRISFFFRKYFPDRGPALYEKHLKKGDFPTALWSSMNDEIQNYVNLFMFLEMEYSLSEREISSHKNYELGIDPLKAALNGWFNNFWYGNLEYEKERLSHIRPKGELCMLGITGLLKGMHSFPNVETWAQHKYFLKNVLFPDEVRKVMNFELTKVV